ncbi:MAG: hypothetical protein M3R55_12890 [Acidobacteriota bacterium]|nr:hypothetical protein [Acidobacteriota bacterium]
MMPSGFEPAPQQAVHVFVVIDDQDAVAAIEWAEEFKSLGWGRRERHGQASELEQGGCHSLPSSFATTKGMKRIEPGLPRWFGR